MIDLHCHIIPGVDDGAPDLSESLLIAQQLGRAGFETVVATPHVLEGRNYLTCQEILEGTRMVNQAIEEAGLKLKILPGAECYIFPELPRWVKEDKIMTLGNMKKFLLVELPMLDVPLYTEKVFFELQVMGITPILAHPERNKELADTPLRLVEWANKGVLLQLNLRSLDGRYGEKASQCAQLLLENRLIHCIGSDAHRVMQENAYQNTLSILLDAIGKDAYEDITINLPNQVLAGERLEHLREYWLTQYNRTKKSGFWNNLLTGNLLKRKKPYNI
ncbi:protein-tyrosine phosphatase [Desulfitobacterium sp. LBE]|uniref:tyrosine-protein phosphatase n=1 Tax=Desulfitobacterium sp. LBE TaxID=884086 RepID=UPI00119B6F7D|nr:CpsB/CapC family capsule biosynthesis tyrosine phosphatase [Desulfitobacterium sp. LBE]TWH59742.1 protein-tyrosine phosphatase [Desulfitobacterium sp. LBE]